jgi:hypothetical protein
MGQLEESVGLPEEAAVKPDRMRKYKAGKHEKAKGNADLRGILTLNRQVSRPITAPAIHPPA